MQSRALWANLADETSAQIFLDKMLNTKPTTSSSSDAYSSFFQLPYQEQLKRLVTVGTLRPVFDEYITENDFNTFWEDYKDTLLDGIPMEFLVKDRNGSITAEDIGETGAEKYKVREEIYGKGDEKLKRQERVYDAFGHFKALRAEYEEKLFKEGSLPLENKPSEK